MAVEDERKIIERAKKGDPEAWAAIIAHYKPLVVKCIFATLPDGLKSDTDDVVQEVFVRALKYLDRFEYRYSGGFTAWLRTIAVSCCMNLVRESMRKAKAAEDSRGGGRIDDAMWVRALKESFLDDEVNPALEKIGVILRRMKWDCRVLLVAKVAYDVSPAEIARVTRAAFVPDGETSVFGKGFLSWFAGLFNPLEGELKERRDHCWEKFKTLIREDDTRSSRDRAENEGADSEGSDE